MFQGCYRNKRCSAKAFGRFMTPKYSNWGIWQIFFTDRSNYLILNITCKFKMYKKEPVPQCVAYKSICTRGYLRVDNIYIYIIIQLEKVLIELGSASS